MEINTMFNVGDVCYLIKDFKAYEGKVTFIDISITGEGTDIEYEVEYKIPKGLFNEDFSRGTFKSEALFLSKEDAKNALEEAERIAKTKKENDEKFGDYNDGKFTVRPYVKPLIKNYANNEALYSFGHTLK